MAKRKPAKRKSASRREGLTPKQRAFVEAYTGAAGGNGTQAARLAGYKGNDATLSAVANENLRKPLVREAIAAATKATTSKAIATRKERQEFFTSVMRGTECTTPMFTMYGKPIKDQYTGEQVKAAPEPKERLKAGELLGRMQGDFIDRIEVRAEEALKGALVGLRKAMGGEAWTFEKITEFFAEGE